VSQGKTQSAKETTLARINKADQQTMDAIRLLLQKPGLSAAVIVTNALAMYRTYLQKLAERRKGAKSA